MKKITFLMILLMTSLGYAQLVTVQDFEAGGIDAGFGDGVATAILADPASGGTNGMVAQIIAGAGGNIWQGANVTLDQPVDLTQTLPADRTMEIDVYSDSATPISMLVRVIGTVNNEASAVVTHPGGGVWATLTATFDTSLEGKPIANGIYTGFVVFPNWDTTTDDFINPAIARTVYFDNIAGFTAVVEPDAEPTSPAPTPGVSNPAGYFSIYSDAYVDQPNVVFGAFDVGTQDITEIEIAPGDNILKVVTTAAPGRNFFFADWGTTVDVSNMTNYHMDYWIDTPFTTGLVMDHKFSNHVGDAGETSAFSATPGVSTLGEWVSIDIPISAMTNGDATQLRNALRQYILTVAGADLDTRVVYLDNIYLYNASLSTDEFASNDFRIYPNPTKNNWNIKSNTTISTVTVYDVLGKQVTTLAPNASDVEIRTDNITAGIYFARIEGTNGSKTVKLIKE
jgi:hypothetical protein